MGAVTPSAAVSSILSPRRRVSSEKAKLEDIPEMTASMPTSPIPAHLVPNTGNNIMGEVAVGGSIAEVAVMQENEDGVAVAPAMISPSATGRESVVGTHASLENVVSSRKIRSQFLIELAVRFAMLSNLKILDSTIDAKHLEMGEKLGGGTFGTVCKAKLRGLDVAVKQLNAGALTPETILALKIEVEILSKLRHPNIVLFIGISLTPTLAAMVTEWCERGALSDMLKSHSEKISARTCLKLALDIARGMWYLHSSERLLIIHRDLKSPNVLIGLAGSAKVADFGLAVMKERLPSDQHDHEFHGNAGTPQWMAPEIMRREEYGQKVDVYSFGITLTELLTRRVPFRDTYRGLEFKDSVLERNERPTIPFWATTGKGAASESHKLGELVMECTEMDPKKRPSFAQIIDILESLFFTLEHNEMRAFEDYDLPRWMECLDGGDFDEVTHSANEIVDVLESVKCGKASHAEEKRATFLQHVKPLIKSCLSRVGYGKAARLKEEGAEYEYEPLAASVISNLVRTIALLVEMTMEAVRSGQLAPAGEEEEESNVRDEFGLAHTPSSSSLLSSSSSPPQSPEAELDMDYSLRTLFPSAKPYHLETLVDIFLDASDGASIPMTSVLTIIRCPMIKFHPMLFTVLENKLEQRIVELKTADLSLGSSAISMTMLENDQTASMTGEDTERKDLEDASLVSPINNTKLGNEASSSSTKINDLLSKCQRYGLLPARFSHTFLADSVVMDGSEGVDAEEEDEKSLEEDIAKLELELLAKKTRLAELRRAQEVVERKYKARSEATALPVAVHEDGGEM